MRKNRFWLSLSFAFVLLLTLVGTGFGLFYVGDTDPVSVDNIGTRVDDIEENYILEDAGVNQDNYYDVYFFCTPYAAQVDPSQLIRLAPGTGGNGYDSAVRFYWWDGGTAAQESQPSQSNYGQNGWRKIRVYRSISVEQFNNIGTPVAGKGNMPAEKGGATPYWDCDTQNGQDKYWPLDFSGWTANRQAASNTINFNSGAYNQGNFDYVDAFSPLSQIDSGNEDGSTAENNVIYLYPIFTTGKDYSRSADLDNNLHQQPAMRLSFSYSNGYKGKGHYFFSQDGEDNSAMYTYKNLIVGKDDLGKYSFEVTPMSWSSQYERGWDWRWEKTDTVSMSGAWASTGNYQLVDMPGTYNISVRLYNQAYNRKKEDLDSFASTSYKNASESPESGVVVKKYVLTNIDLSTSTKSAIESDGCDIIINYGDTSKAPTPWEDATHNLFPSNHSGYSGFLCYIQVERVYEFHLLGGPYGTFNYDETQYFYEGEIGVTDTDPKTRTFGLNNVYFDASERTFTDTYVGVGDEGNRIGTFRNNVFTIDFMNTVWANNIQAFTADELAEINSYATNTYHEEKPNYVSIDENGILQKAVAKINSTDTDYDYELSNVSNPEAVRTLLKINQTGFYNFRIQVKFKSTASTTALESYVDSIKIAVSPVKSDYFVKIYQNDKFDRLYSDTSGENGFIDHNGKLSGGALSGNKLLYVAYFNEFGSPLSSPNVRFLSLETGEQVLYGTIQKTYCTIRDHVTKNAVDPNMILEKNYVFYVSN